MANLSQIKLPNGTIYDLKDNGALQLTGGQVTGPVTFGDSISIDEATIGDLVVNGSASFTNNIQANTINGVVVGSSPKFTDTNTEVSTLTLAAGSTAGTTLTSGGKFTLTAGSKTVSFTMPTIPSVPSNIVNTITTTAGAHTAITSQKGNVSFNVPTTAAHVGAATSDHVHGNITNGGDITATAPTIASGDQIIINDHSASKITNGPTFDGSTTTTALTPKGTWESFAKSDTNTTYALSGALSSHKFTSTLTAGGSGSGTSTSDFTLAAGTGITITDDTSARKMTIACSVTNTDTKVSTAAVTSAVLYYPIVGEDTTSAATKFYDKTGLMYMGVAGTTSDIGGAVLTLGNSTASGTANNKQGELVLYSSSTYKGSFKTDALSANRTYTLPDKDGTLATTDLANASNHGLMSNTDKIYLDGLSDAIGTTSSTITIKNGSSGGRTFYLETNSSDTDDTSLISAITSLGWDSDVIVS